MSKPTDKVTEWADHSGVESQKIPKIGMISPGFRDVQDTEFEAPKNASHKNPSDRVNARFFIIAILVFLVIFSLLEYKQYRESKAESQQTTESPVTK